MLVNESTFDDHLTKIGDLYEEAKDKLHNVIPSVHGDDQRDLCRALEIVQELRNIAAVNLKSIHEIKDN